MSDDRKDIPQPTAGNMLTVLQRLRETVQTYMGRQGDILDRGVTLRDLGDAGVVTLRPGFLAGGRRLSPILGPGPAVEDAYEEDLTPPPTPTGLLVTPGISTLVIQWATPTYTQGHGHDRTIIYGATYSGTGPLPTFANAVELKQTTGVITDYSTNPATEWHIWIKWKTKDGVLSVSPAGGANGFTVTTGQDVSLLLTALTGQLTQNQLAAALGTRIDLIDASSGVAGSVNARVAAEASTRATVDGYLGAQYTVRVDVGGVVGGYGISGTSAPGAGATIDFGIRADKFFIMPPAGVSNVGSAAFIYQATPTTINGVSVPAGLYLSDLFVENGTITNAKMANLAVDTAKIADLAVSNAKIGNLAVDTAKIADLAVSTAKIVDLAVSTAKIGDLQVSTLKIADNAVTVPLSANATISSALTSSYAIVAETGFGTFPTAGINVSAMSVSLIDGQIDYYLDAFCSDGTTINGQVLNFNMTTSGNIVPLAASFMFTLSKAGSWKFRLQMKKSTLAAGAVTHYSTTITSIGVKK